MLSNKNLVLLQRSGAYGGCVPKCYIDNRIWKKNWLLSIILGGHSWQYMEIENLIWKGAS